MDQGFLAMRTSLIISLHSYQQSAVANEIEVKTLHKDAGKTFYLAELDRVTYLAQQVRLLTGNTPVIQQVNLMLSKVDGLSWRTNECIFRILVLVGGFFSREH